MYFSTNIVKTHQSFTNKYTTINKLKSLVTQKNKIQNTLEYAITVYFFLMLQLKIVIFSFCEGNEDLQPVLFLEI